MVRMCLAPLALMALSGCVPVQPPADASDTVAACPVLGDRNWHAWVDKMPGPGAQMTLNISGEVDMPTPGYSVKLVPGPADRMNPPGLRFRLEASAPDGIVTQVVTPTTVRLRAPTPYAQLREIIIGCGEGALVTIPDVMITE